MELDAAAQRKGVRKSVCSDDETLRGVGHDRLQPVHGIESHQGAVHMAEDVVIRPLLHIVVRGGDAECDAECAASFGTRIRGRQDSLWRGRSRGRRARTASGQERGDRTTCKSEPSESASELPPSQPARPQGVKNTLRLWINVRWHWSDLPPGGNTTLC